MSRACDLLEVSCSGYYNLLKRPFCLLPDLLGIKIGAIFESSMQTYGMRRIKAALATCGIRVGRSKIKTKMKEYGLVCKATKKYKKATTNSNHKLSVAPNLLEQDFTATCPNRVWVSDFTYLWTMDGWMYLAVIIEPHKTPDSCLVMYWLSRRDGIWYNEA